MIRRLHNLATAAALFGLATLPIQAHAWTTKIDCEGGSALSKVAEGAANTFTSSFSKTLYSNEQAGTGSQSCKMGITKGAEGWGEWGGVYAFPEKLKSGSQLWIRLSVFVPNGFNYTGQPWLKFMRVHTASPSNSNQGYLDLYINPLNGSVWDPVIGKDVNNPYTFYYEGKANIRTLGTRPANNIALGQWESYEIYYKLDTKSTDAGGTGRIRIWKNNVLLGDLTDQQTLVDSTTYAESFFLFTYWNGTAPATQSLYVDDIIVTTDMPTNKDSKGNAFIGGTVPKSVPTPMAPSNIAID